MAPGAPVSLARLAAARQPGLPRVREAAITRVVARPPRDAPASARTSTARPGIVEGEGGRPGGPCRPDAARWLHWTRRVLRQPSTAHRDRAATGPDILAGDRRPRREQRLCAFGASGLPPARPRLIVPVGGWPSVTCSASDLTEVVGKSFLLAPLSSSAPHPSALTAWLNDPSTAPAGQGDDPHPRESRGLTTTTEPHRKSRRCPSGKTSALSVSSTSVRAAGRDHPREELSSPARPSRGPGRYSVPFHRAAPHIRSSAT